LRGLRCSHAPSPRRPGWALSRSASASLPGGPSAARALPALRCSDAPRPTPARLRRALRERSRARPPRGLVSLLLRLRHAGGTLTELHLAGPIVEGRGAPELLADRAALPYGRPARDGVPPAGDAGDVVRDPLVLVLGEDPG